MHILSRLSVRVYNLYKASLASLVVKFKLTILSHKVTKLARETITKSLSLSKAM